MLRQQGLRCQHINLPADVARQVREHVHGQCGHLPVHGQHPRESRRNDSSPTHRAQHANVACCCSRDPRSTSVPGWPRLRTTRWSPTVGKPPTPAQRSPAARSAPSHSRSTSTPPCCAATRSYCRNTASPTSRASQIYYGLLPLPTCVDSTAKPISALGVGAGRTTTGTATRVITMALSCTCRPRQAAFASRLSA